MRDFEDFAKTETDVTNNQDENDIGKKIKHNIRIANICLFIITLCIGIIFDFSSILFFLSLIIFLSFLIYGRKINKRSAQINRNDISNTASRPETVSIHVEVKGVNHHENDFVVTNGTQNGYNVNRHKVTGTAHYQSAFESLGSNNPDYDMSKKEIVEEDMIDERIYEYTFYPDKVELIPEPENQYDPNAIQVVVDDLLIGYIKAGSCAHIHKLMRENRMGKISIDMYGGKYKIVTSEYDDDDKETYTLEKDSTPYGAVLKIEEYV